MALNRLWTKLFKRTDEADAIALHSAGATVRHKNPFEDLEVPRNEDELTKEFIDKWVAPFYMTIPAVNDIASLESLATASKEIDLATTTKLLGYFDWRPKSTGAFFAAVNNYTELEDIIGRHLLKSEVCYAGESYSLALATFSTEASKDYLRKYLEYYLQRKDLWFDQAAVFCALEHVDKDSAFQLLNKWQDFTSDKPNWDLKRSRDHFANCIKSIQRIRQRAIEF
jgi:hypothetical protein